MTLAEHDIQPGTRLQVVAYREDSAYVSQLQRLGLVVGTEFEVVRRAPLNDPVEIRFRGYSLALRTTEANAIEVHPVA